jgi:hypothetical protein
MKKAPLVPVAFALALAPMLALAQADKPAAKPAAKAAAKPDSRNHPAKKLAPSARKAVEEVTPIDDDSKVVIDEAALAVAKQVYTGEIKCELGASVQVTPLKREGMFLVTTKNYRFRMHPVESRTGAIRLEDPQRGAMWLQLGNKSMLMSQKLGQRLADECQSAKQVEVAEDLRKNPRPSILDAAPAGVTATNAAPAAASTSAATPAASTPATATPTTGASR